MSVAHPTLLIVAVLATLALTGLYVWSQRRRVRILAGTGLTPARPRGDGLRRHLPPAVYLTAVGLLLVAVAQPQATLPVTHAAGTVVLAFDVSNSMKATDVAPDRLSAAKTAATEFVAAQPESVNFAVVAFDQGALTTQQVSRDHDATIAAIGRLRVNGGTSLGHAILASLTVIVGRPVTLPDAESGQTAPGQSPPDQSAPGQSTPDLGYFGNATIVLLSDGENTGGPDPVAAAGLAARAGVRIETVGVGTVQGGTVEIDGYQVATSLDENRLTEIAQTTAGTYHRAENAQALHDVYESLDLRLTTQREPVELTGAAAALAVLLLTIGGVLMTTWFGRIL